MMKEIILRSARCDVRMYIYFYAFLVVLVKFGDAEVIEERRRELMFIHFSFCKNGDSFQWYSIVLY